MELNELQAAVEGILFATGDPVPVERLCLVLEQDRATMDSVCQKLADEYSFARRGIRILHLDASWQMCSAPEVAGYIRKTMEGRKPAKLSQPAMEVLAIIAYFQPVTRAYIEQVRGVDSSYTVSLLLERDLICEAGRLNVPGRPMQFKTTKNFLRSFSLASLDDLPSLPSAGQEGEQITLNLENAIRKLQEERAGASGGAEGEATGQESGEGTAAAGSAGAAGAAGSTGAAASPQPAASGTAAAENAALAEAPQKDAQPDGNGGGAP